MAALATAISQRLHYAGITDVEDLTMFDRVFAEIFGSPGTTAADNLDVSAEPALDAARA